MLDPFPFPAPPLLRAAATKLCDYAHLPTLALHIHEVIFAFLLYHWVCSAVSPFVSARLFPATYPRLPYRTKLNWDVHVVSLVQSTLINTLALYVIWCDEQRRAFGWRERVWGYTGGQGMVQAFATGYFLWDLWVCSVHVDIFGWGLLAHAVSALFVFANGFRPFVNYYGPIFILYELSSPFLNFHWFFDKLDMTGSDPQLYNGIVLISSFFLSRLCWGSFQTYRVFGDIWKAIEYQQTPAGAVFLEALKLNITTATAGTEDAQVLRFAGNKYIPTYLAVLYLAANLTLNLLNIYWFSRMIATIRARFDPPWGTKKLPAKNEVEIVTGLESDGRRSVEVDALDVRQRRRTRKA